MLLLEKVVADTALEQIAKCRARRRIERSCVVVRAELGDAIEHLRRDGIDASAADAYLRDQAIGLNRTRHDTLRCILVWLRSDV